MSMRHRTMVLLLAISLFVPSYVLAEEIPEMISGPEPIEIRKSTEEGTSMLEKIYILSKNQSEDLILKDDIEEEGIIYRFTEMKKEDNTREEAKPYSQQKTIYSDTNNTKSIIAKFSPTMEITTEDGYVGTLQFDYTTLSVSAAGQGTETYQVNESRTYPNLVDADTSLVPKSINKDGNTLNLAGIEWQASTSDNIDGQEIAIRYTAIANYIGTAIRTYTKGYTATAYYMGEVKKMVDETTTYTVKYEGEPIADAGQKSKNKFWRYWWVGLLGGMALSGGGYGVYRLIRKRKKGY